MVVVPGYRSPYVKSLKKSLGILFSIGVYYADIYGDVALALSLHGDLQVFRVLLLLAILTMRFLCLSLSVRQKLAWFFIIFPSVIMALLPYQSMLERFLSLCQLRFIWEILESIGSVRKSERVW